MENKKELDGYEFEKNLLKIGQPKFYGNVECDGDLCRLVPTEPEPEESDT